MRICFCLIFGLLASASLVSGIANLSTEIRSARLQLSVQTAASSALSQQERAACYRTLYASANRVRDHPELQKVAFASLLELRLLDPAELEPAQHAKLLNHAQQALANAPHDAFLWFDYALALEPMSGDERVTFETSQRALEMSVNLGKHEYQLIEPRLIYCLRNAERLSPNLVSRCEQQADILAEFQPGVFAELGG